MALSRTQVDKLGERLKAGPISETDLRLLDEFRGSFFEAYAQVLANLVRLAFKPTGRPAKTTLAIVNKLRRESIRLSQVQDVAGCRIVVRTLTEQDEAVSRTRSALAQSALVDRRTSPSHGYRAVHVVASVAGKPVEIQVRTELQHLWAQTSESMAYLVDPGLKYGQGPANYRALMLDWSEALAEAEPAWELHERLDVPIEERLSTLPTIHRILELSADVKLALELAASERAQGQ